MSQLMYDAIHANVAHIPADAPKVAGYISGTPDIQWTAADWARFPKAGLTRIEQGYGSWEPLHANVFDVERGAVTPAQVVSAVKLRMSKGHTWTTVYADDANLQLIVDALEAGGAHGWYYGHVDCWFANWNLTRAEADALLGKGIRGITCRAVQFQHQEYFDVSTTLNSWHPYVPPAPSKLEQAVTEAEDLASRAADLVTILKAAGA